MSTPTEPTEPKVHPKVVAATLGGGAGTVVADFVLYVLDQFLWDGTDNIPAPVTAFTYLVITTGLTFLAGYLKKS